MAHAVHPNYESRHEPRHKPALNGGPVLKVNAQQRYATSARTATLVEELCRKAARRSWLQHYVKPYLDLLRGSTDRAHHLDAARRPDGGRRQPDAQHALVPRDGRGRRPGDDGAVDGWVLRRRVVGIVELPRSVTPRATQLLSYTMTSFAHRPRGASRVSPRTGGLLLAALLLSLAAVAASCGSSPLPDARPTSLRLVVNQLDGSSFPPPAGV